MDTAPSPANGDLRPLVSVIVRSKDRIPWLLELLQILFSQSYTNCEIVVVDSSTRATEDELARLRAVADPRLRVIHTPPRGCPAAANEGVRQARGEILAFVDDDDLPIGNDWLAAHVRNYRDPSCLGVNGFQVFPCDHRASDRSVFPALRRRLLQAHGPFKDPWCFAYDDQRKVGIDHLNGGNSSIRRSAAVLGGGWDEFLDYHNEHSLFLRLHKRKPKGTYLVYEPDAKMTIRKDVPGGLDARFSQETAHRVDALARYFVWVVGREHPRRIYGLAPLFVPYFSILAGVAGYELAAGREASRIVESVRGILYAPISLAKHAIATRPAPHKGFDDLSP